MPEKIQGPPPKKGCQPFTLVNGQNDAVITEEPLVLELDSQELVTMRTPGHDLELTLGFLLSERVLPQSTRIQDIQLEERSKDGVARVCVKLPAGASAQTGRLTRVHEIRASCGLCGIPSIDHLSHDLPPLKPFFPRYSRPFLQELPQQMRRHQALFERTGGCHAAALADSSGLLLVREDVGRHNAVDKVLGAAFQQGLSLDDKILVLSGRSGFELLLKGLRLGLAVFVSVSAPSSYALQLAEEAGATVLGFARTDNAVLYTDDGRVIPEDPDHD